MLGLVRRDLVQPGQRTVIIQEPPRCPLQPGLRQPRHQVAQLVGLQGRVAPARQHDVALHHALRDRPGRDDPRREAVSRPQLLQREKRGHGLRHAGRWQGEVGFPRLQHRAALRIQQHIGDRGRPEFRRRDQVGRIERPRRRTRHRLAPPRHRAGRAVHHLGHRRESRTGQEPGQHHPPRNHRFRPFVSSRDSRFLPDSTSRSCRTFALARRIYLTYVR